MRQNRMLHDLLELPDPFNFRKEINNAMAATPPITTKSTSASFNRFNNCISCRVVAIAFDPGLSCKLDEFEEAAELLNALPWR